MMKKIDELRSAMQTVTPEPDTSRKRAAIELAKKSFAENQGMQTAKRPISKVNRLKGWLAMQLETIPTKNFSPLGLIGGSALLASVALVMFTPLTQQRFTDDTSAIPQNVNGVNAPDLEVTRMVTPDATQPLNLEMADKNQRELLMALKRNSQVGSLSGVSAGSVAISNPNVIQRMVNEVEVFAGNLIEKTGTTYSKVKEQAIQLVSENPVSTFAAEVDTASYSIVRSMLRLGQMPPKDAIRIEELVNYFPYDYPNPVGDQAFASQVSLVQTPWNENTKLVHIGIKGKEVSPNERKPLNVVFLVDTSGSMSSPEKLPLLKQSIKLFAERLSSEDKIAIVTYAGSSSIALSPVSADDDRAIEQAVNNLTSGGSTAGAEGLELAYNTASEMKSEGRIARVILATDGDFNVGPSDPSELEEYISSKRDEGTFLSVLGFGARSFNDAIMQTLAEHGNGIASHIDTLAEAKKVLSDQIMGTLIPIAEDVKLQVEFNPEVISEYRLIGYASRELSREDFNDDKSDAGEIGSGHTVTAIYEVTPVGSPAQKVSPLRYLSQPSSSNNMKDEIGFLSIRHKELGAIESKLQTKVIRDDLVQAEGDVAFSIAVAAFGQLLRGDKYLGDWTYDDIEDLLRNASDDDYGLRNELRSLVAIAKMIGNN
jgi:Ca-activated chloride channel family protein